MRRDRRAEESGERREREGEESRGEMLPCRFGVLGGGIQMLYHLPLVLDLQHSSL